MAFKTRICVLYKKGHCNRQNCSFAHGDAELRRHNTSSSSFNGRRDYRGVDLREKLGRQRSPPQRHSLDRDPPPSYVHNSPRFGKKSDWGHRKRQHFDGETDFSGSLRLSDGAERHAKERKSPSIEFRDVHGDQYKQIQSEIDMLEDHKQQLQIYLEESVQEADNLKSKIEELETQLSAEKEECRRVSSKLRKFVKASNRHTKIHEELKRSQARLERLGDQLGSDARAAAEDDISINVLSDEETLGNLLMSPKNDKVSPRKDEMPENRLMGPRKDQYKASPSKKRMRVPMGEADEKSKQARPATREWLSLGNMRSERHSRRDPHILQTKITDEISAEVNEISNSGPFVSNSKPVRRKSNFNSVPSVDKFKDLKSTRMAAANMMDREVEVDELNEKLEAQEISFDRIEEGSTYDDTFLPIPVLPPPPPPVVGKAYVQYKGKDETVDVVNDDGDEDDKDDEMLDVDIV